MYALVFLVLDLRVASCLVSGWPERFPLCSRYRTGWTRPTVWQALCLLQSETAVPAYQLEGADLSLCLSCLYALLCYSVILWYIGIVISQIFCPQIVVKGCSTTFVSASERSSLTSRSFISASHKIVLLVERVETLGHAVHSSPHNSREFRHSDDKFIHEFAIPVMLIGFEHIFV